MTEGGHSATRAQFEANLLRFGRGARLLSSLHDRGRKLSDFREDMGPLLRPGLAWDIDAAMNTVLERVIALLPGDPWKGSV